LVKTDFEGGFGTAVWRIGGADIPLVEERPFTEVVEACGLVDGEEA
jgi:hypothetical protein